jgi:dynein heavy chain
MKHDGSPGSKWILLDGDLDANWIESMNSVMDDNRMLTLPNNERIPLKPHMKLIFELRDLVHATPATASRAGVIFIPTAAGHQWKSILTAWLRNNAKQPWANDKSLVQMRALFDEYIPATVLWKKINVQSVVPLGKAYNYDDAQSCQILLWMLDELLRPYHGEDPELMEQLFVFCMIWSFGSMLTITDAGFDCRKCFSDWWRSEWKNVKIPSRDTVFDYWLDPESNTLDTWTKSPFFYEVTFDSTTTNMSTVTVPTPETAGVTFWMDNMVRQRHGCLMCGPAGTGKTQMVKGFLQSLKEEDYVFQPINFNFYTTSDLCFNTMGAMLEKKTGVNFGPPGNRSMIYFVDDVNLPEVDKYNTQSAIELVRQVMEYETGWEIAKLAFKNIWKAMYMASMNPGANPGQPNPRLLRNFMTFGVGLPGPTSLLTIYQTFLDGHLKRFEPDVKSLVSNLIKGALGLHNSIAGTFRKTAANFHYEFNIRHIAMVFQGLLSSQPEQFMVSEKFIVLWLHESERVYCDRLVSRKTKTSTRSSLWARAKKSSRP